MKPIPARANRYLFVAIAMTALACLTLVSTTPAQDASSIVPDSLVRLLHENRDDNEKRAEAFAKVIDFLFDARCYEQAKPYIEDFQESDFVRQDKYYSTMGDYFRGMAVVITEPDEAFSVLKKAEQEYLLLKKSPQTEKLGAKIYLALGYYYYESYLMFSQYYDCMKKVNEINKELDDDWLAYQIELHDALTQTILVHYREALSLYRNLIGNESYDAYNKYAVHFNMGLLYKWENQPDSARIWFEEASCEAVTKQDSVRAAGELLLLPSLDHDYDKVIADVEGGLEKIKESGDVKTVVTVMYGLAKSYHQVGRSKEAISMLETCLGFCGDESTNIWLKSIVLEELKTITTDLRDYKKCCEIQAVLDSVNATFNLEEQLKMVNSLQLQHEYAEAEAQAQYERDMERIKETRKSVITYFIIAVLILAIVLALIMLSRKNIILKAKQAEKERLSDELESKKQELVSKLLSQTKTNDALNEIKEQLASMEGMKEADRADVLVKTVRKINEVINANSDDNLDFYFLQVHPKFYDNLRKDFPDLTLGELRLCALIKLNMNTKDIASINNITINGVKVARWRLRKKLGMNDANDNLSDFLANY
ncbi:MAG: hypothetical protein IJK36_05470 [Bacteroidales bacterium]|nr:hypothetical protein [Bacteroidales bacterium]